MPCIAIGGCTVVERGIANGLAGLSPRISCCRVCPVCVCDVTNTLDGVVVAVVVVAKTD